jgi:peroxiredoxin family protein
MSRTTTFFVVSSDPERLWRAALWALTAASVDETVHVWLTAPALRALGDDVVLAAGAESAQMPDALSLLVEARSLGARILTCDTELAIAGLSEDALGGVLDAVESLPSFWRESAVARVVV